MTNATISRMFMWCKRGEASVGIDGELLSLLLSRGSRGSELIDRVSGLWYTSRMRKTRLIEQNRCYHLISRLSLRAFHDEEKDCAVNLLRRVEEFSGIVGCVMKSGKFKSSRQLQRYAEIGIPCSCYCTGFSEPHDGQCEALPSEDVELVKKILEGLENSAAEFSLNRLCCLRDVRGLIISPKSMEADLAHT